LTVWFGQFKRSWMYPDEPRLEHVWIELIATTKGSVRTPVAVTAQVCRRCGVVRRADGRDMPCVVLVPLPRMLLRCVT